MIQYSSNPGDLVCDFFLGSFSTAKVAIGLHRKAVGFEKSKIAFDYQIKQIKTLVPGYLLPALRTPPPNIYSNQGKPISSQERELLRREYEMLRRGGGKKRDVLAALANKSGRGYWSLLKIIDGTTNKSTGRKDTQSLFG